ncbi:MAG: PIN domain-containing protein [Methanobrevibacter sp.]|nr:PIN domain-containing protein [Methanobrevibacter sp.]
MIFLDSSFILALLNDNDNNHQKAVELLEIAPEINVRQKVINNIVLLEVLNKLNKQYYKGKEEEIINFLLSMDEIHFVDDEDYEEAIQLYKYYGYNVNYSDCLILLTMEHCNLNDIVSFDDDFNKIDGINNFTI